MVGLSSLKNLLKRHPGKRGKKSKVNPLSWTSHPTKQYWDDKAEETIDSIRPLSEIQHTIGGKILGVHAQSDFTEIIPTNRTFYPRLSAPAKAWIDDIMADE